MFWSLSFQLLPGEKIVEENSVIDRSTVKAAYSIFLTNKRVIFKFDGLGSSLNQSFFYNEIQELQPVKRFFIKYLQVTTEKRQFLYNVYNPGYWANRIMELQKDFIPSENIMEQTRPVSKETRKRELLDMLTRLRNNDILTEKEFEEKVNLLSSKEF